MTFKPRPDGVHMVNGIVEAVKKATEPHNRAFQAALLITFMLAFAVVQLVSLFVAGQEPVRQFSVDRLTNTKRAVTRVTAQAAQDGLRIGDVYDWNDATRDQCARRFAAAQRAGDTFQLPVTRNGAIHVITLRVRPLTVRDRLALLPVAALKIVGMMVGVLLIARGGNLFSYFSGFAFFGTAGVVGEANNAALPFPAQPILYGVVGAVSVLFFYFHVEAMIALCKPPPREQWFWRTPAVLATLFVLSTREQYVQHALFDPCRPGIDAVAYYTALVFLWLWPLVGYLVVLLDPSARDRLERPLVARWVFWSYFIGGSGPVINLFFAIAGPQPFDRTLNATYMVMAVGFVYVALRHHLINVRWAVDRAVVYGATLTVVVALVTAFEFSVAKLGTRSAQSPGNVAVEATLVIGLALLIRPLHRRIDAFFERTLFRTKHAVEKKLRLLARDCGNFQHADALLRHVCEEVQRVLGAGRVIYYEYVERSLKPRAVALAEDGSSNHDFPDVGADDAAFVRMCSAQRAVDLAEIHSVAGQEGTIFPVFIQGGIAGALMCGASAERDRYDPDERKLLASVARETAIWIRTLPP